MVQADETLPRRLPQPPQPFGQRAAGGEEIAVSLIRYALQERYAGDGQGEEQGQRRGHAPADAGPPHFAQGLFFPVGGVEGHRPRR